MDIHVAVAELPAILHISVEKGSVVSGVEQMASAGAVAALGTVVLADSSCTVAEPGLDAGEVARLGYFHVALDVVECVVVALGGMALSVVKLTRVVAAGSAPDLAVD